MKFTKDQVVLSAGDLSNHIACDHLSYLDLAAAKQRINAPDFREPALTLLQERGLAFEQGYLRSLKEQGIQITEPGAEDDEMASERTISAMHEGADVIYQATLGSGRWQGRADFLLKVDKPSNLGPWSYEVIDSKLAKETGAGTILQLCLYSQLVEDIQGYRPEFMHVITPENEFSRHTYRLDDFHAYYRFVKQRLKDLVKKDEQPIPTYPNPIGHCDICRWWQVCDSKRRSDDHLSLVAGLSSSQAVEIKKREIETLEKFAQIPLPLPNKPTKGAIETYERLREQARVQLETRMRREPVFEHLAVEEGKGFFKLPVPSEGGVFSKLCPTCPSGG